MSIFRPKTPLPPPSIPIPPQSSNNNVVPTAPNALNTSPPPPTQMPSQSSSDNVTTTSPNALDTPPSQIVPQKAFVKSKMFEKDIAVLSIAYIMAENPELKRLIRLIAEIDDKDTEDQLTNVLETCAKLSIQLASATEAHPAEATEAITEFIKTVAKIKLESDGLSVDALTRMVEDEMAKIKSAYPQLALNRDSGTSERLSKVLTAAIGGSITVVSIAKDVSAVIPVLGVQSAIGGVVNLLNVIAQTRSNYDVMRQIAATAGEFVVSCVVICSDGTAEFPKLEQALNKFAKKLGDIAKDCEEMSRHNSFWRYLQNTTQKDDLQGIQTKLNIAIELFQTESHIHIQLDIKDLSRKLDYTALNDLPKHPHHDLAECLGGSRDDVLGDVSSWIDRSNEAILWIHGAAGLGKSTVGQQLVRLLKEDHRLAGSVFLTNLTKEPAKTTARGMHPRAIADIAEAARKLDAPHSALQDYFKAYVIDPIRRLDYPYQLVVVVDGLEEWTSHKSFLGALAHIPSPSPVKFILTSRPSHSIKLIFDKIAIESYPLPPVSQEIVEHYFHHHFETINWRGRKPDQLTISELAARAEGLLIWAATICSLLSHEFDQRYPHQILDQILSSGEKVGARSGEQLERLYRDAIATLFPKQDMHEKLQDFLGAMMVLQEALPLRDFACLLPWEMDGQVSDRAAAEIQRRLAAFQTRGEFKSDIIPPAIQQFHLSFLEFMQSTSTEYNERRVAIRAENAHSMVGNRCLEIVFSEFLQSHRGKVCTYSELRGVELYAIKFWPLHISNGTSRLPPTSVTTIKDPMDMITEQDMQRWATLFLPCIAARFQGPHGCDLLDDIPRSVLPHELALMIGDEDVATLLYQLYCLEIAVRLQAMDVQIWIDLGDAYHRLYEHDRNIQSLDEEIIVYRHALPLLPALHSDRSSSLIKLGSALGIRFQQQGASSDIAEGISLHREALLLQPATHPDHSSSLIHFGNGLLTRFQHQGALNDLDEAISLYQGAILLLPATHPNRSWSLIQLGTALLTRFQKQGALSDSDEGISLHREALLLLPATHPDHSRTLSNLGNALLTRFQQQGAQNNLDEAISFLRQSLLRRPAPHLDRSSSLNNLGHALHICFRQQGALSDLDEAISMHQEALLLLPAPHPLRSLSLSSLGSALGTRFEQQGALCDIDEAISLLRESLLHRSAPHPDRSSSLDHLGYALFTRFEQQGALCDLDEAISSHREALLLQPAPHPDRSSSLNNLGSALHTRFKQQAVLSDLDEAISFLRESLLHRPVPHPHRSSSLNTLGSALLTRFEQQDASSDLDEAISFLREALLLHPAPHPLHSQSLQNLAYALQTRFETQGTLIDRDEADSLRQEFETL
ncbi:tetratricopeptide repeat-containing protein [Pholiota molesta]|nr:tetratricopeptide repeat-containing protein [Pholiota molesta]